MDDTRSVDFWRLAHVVHGVFQMWHRAPAVMPEACLRNLSAVMWLKTGFRPDITSSGGLIEKHEQCTWTNGHTEQRRTCSKARNQNLELVLLLTGLSLQQTINQ